MTNLTSIRLRVLPRFPARIVGANGFAVVRDGSELIIQPDYEQLAIVPAVPDQDETFFQAWTRDIDTYNIIPFSALVANIQDVIIGDNLSSIDGLTTFTDSAVYFTGEGEAALYTITEFTRTLSGSIGASEFRDALGAGTAGDAVFMADTAAGIRALLDLEPGTDVQAQSQVLQDIVDGVTPFGDLVAANNLSDLNDAPTALANLGGDTAGIAIFGSETEAEVRDYLDILKGFNLDGTTSDQANIEALELAVSRREIDFRGATLLLDAYPTGNRYVNGWCRIENFDEAQTCDTPFPRTRFVREWMIQSGQRHTSWPQGNLDWDAESDTLILAYSEGTSHTSSDNVALHTESTDGGRTWKKPTIPFISGTERVQTFAQKLLDGQKFTVNRQGNVTNQRLYGQHLFKIAYLTNALQSTSGSSTFRINANTGMKIGDKFTLPSAVSFAGQSLSGTYTVTAVGTGYVEFTGPGNATSTIVNGGGEFRIEYLQSPWAQIRFTGSVTLGAAIVAEGTYSSQPGVIAGIAGKRDDAGTLYLGCSGGGLGPRIVKVTNAFRDTFASVSWVRSIPGISNGVEPTLKINPQNTSEIFFGVRTQDYGLGNPKVGWTDDEFATATVYEFSAFGRLSPIGVGISPDGTKIAFTLTGERDDPIDAAPIRAGTVNLYTVQTTIADFKANGLANVKPEVLAPLKMVNSEGEGTIGVGVPDCCFRGNDQLIVAAATEEAWARNGRGATDIIGFAIGEYPTLGDADYRPRSVTFTQDERPLTDDYIGTVTVNDGANTASLTWTKKPDTRTIVQARSSEGLNRQTFADRDGVGLPNDSANYVVFVTPIGEGTARVVNQTRFLFDVETRDNAGNLKDISYHLGVFVPLLYNQYD